MNLSIIPWLELAILSSLIGGPIVGSIRSPRVAYRWCLAFASFAFLCTFLAWLNFYLGAPPESESPWSLQHRLFRRTLFQLDELSAPLVPAVALLHLLTALATARTHMRRFSFAWSLVFESLRLATFSCQDPWTLVTLLSLSVIPPYVELRNRGRSTRIYAFHMVPFVGLLVVGQAMVGWSVGTGPGPAPWWSVLPLLAAILILCATVPAHCWLRDWLDQASLGIALLYLIPLSGVYAAVRLLLPVAPTWILSAVGWLSVITAVYAAGMASVQKDTRRFFANLLLSHASLVLVGLELHTELSMTGSLALWFSVLLSLGGFGIMLRALEARFGRLNLSEYHGLYNHSPTLAVCFLLTGLATVGFPGTVGFISCDLLVDSCVEASPVIGLGVILAAALNGIAVVRAYFLLFTGTRHTSTVTLGLGLRERFAVLTFSMLILGGGFYPQPGISSRLRAAEEILDGHHSQAPDKATKAEPHPVAEGTTPAPGQTPLASKGPQHD